MSENKAKLSKKGIAAIVCAFVIVVAVVLGIALKSYSNAMKIPEFQVKTIQFTYYDNMAKTQLFAHRGFRAIAPENTVPAFNQAGVAGFRGAECDVFRTSDGVWVISHDNNIKRMMDGKVNIEDSTYEELLKYNVDKGYNIDRYPELKIATLDEYLDLCKQYKMKAVIELKSKNNTEHYDEIIAAVKKHKVKAIYISFYADDLKAMRKLDTKSAMFLLTSKITDKAIETAKGIENCGVEFNAEEKANLKNDGEAIKKITDAGLEPACWGANEPELIKQLAGYNVFYITTDCVTY